MEKTMLSTAAIYAYVTAHAAEILGIWLILEQLIAANPKIKANSTFQLVSNVVKTILGKISKK